MKQKDGINRWTSCTSHAAGNGFYCIFTIWFPQIVTDQTENRPQTDISLQAHSRISFTVWFLMRFPYISVLGVSRSNMGFVFCSFVSLPGTRSSQTIMPIMASVCLKRYASFLFVVWPHLPTKHFTARIHKGHFHNASPAAEKSMVNSFPGNINHKKVITRTHWHIG